MNILSYFIFKKRASENQHQALLIWAWIEICQSGSLVCSKHSYVSTAYEMGFDVRKPFLRCLQTGFSMT